MRGKAEQLLVTPRRALVTSERGPNLGGMGPSDPPKQCPAPPPESLSLYSGVGPGVCVYLRSALWPGALHGKARELLM